LLIRFPPNKKLTGPPRADPSAAALSCVALCEAMMVWAISYILLHYSYSMNQDAYGVQYTPYDFMYRYALLEV